MKGIIVYSKGCPKYRALIRKFNAANIRYTIKTNIDEIVKACNRACTKDVPILEILLDPETGEVDYYDFKESNEMGR